MKGPEEQFGLTVGFSEEANSLSGIFDNFSKSRKTVEEVEWLSRDVESKVNELNEDEFFDFTDSLSEESLINLRHYLDDRSVKVILKKGFSFSEIHMGEKFGVKDCIDIDDSKLVRLLRSVLLQGEFKQEDKVESVNDRAFRQTLALAPEHKGAVDKFIGQLGQHHTIRPDIFVGEMAKACANPEIGEFQKIGLVDSFEYIYAGGSDRYDEALAKGLVFNDPSKYIETGYFLNLLSRAHGLSKYGPDFSKGVSGRIEESLKKSLEGSEGSYFLRMRAKQVLESIESESYEKPEDFKPFSLSPMQRGVFNEKGLALIDLDGEERKLSFSDLTLSTKSLSNLDIADFEFLQRPYMRSFFEKEFGVGLHEMQLAEQFQFLTFIKSKSEIEVEKVKEFTKKFGTTGMKTFLSLEYGREFGDKIIEMGEKLPEDLAKKLFGKYAEIVESVNSIEQALGDQYSLNREEKENLRREIGNNLLLKGRKLLEDFGGFLEVDQVDELMSNLENIKAEIIVTAGVFKSLFKAKGIELKDLAKTEVEILKGESLVEKDKEEMMRIFKLNRENGYPEKLFNVTIADFEKVLHEETGSDFHILRYGGSIIAFARFKELPNGNVYIGSLNVRPEIKEFAIGGAFLSDLISQKTNNHTIEAEAYSENKMLKHYTGRFGFQITGEIPDYHGTGELFYKMEIPKKIFKKSDDRRLDASEVPFEQAA